MPRNYLRGVTPTGEAYFAHLFDTEHYEGMDTGRYTLMLHLESEDEQAMLAKINDAWSAYLATEEGKKHTFAGVPSNGFKTYREQTYFKFVLPSVIHTRRGVDWERHVSIFDAAKQNITNYMASDKHEIGNGSKVKVAYELVPFAMSDKNFGIALRLLAVQVLELKMQGDTAEAFGFKEEDGYQFTQTASPALSLPDPPSSAPADDDEIPF